MPATKRLQQAREELESVLGSAAFIRSPNLTRLLRYVCEKRLEGHGEDLKEYNIAVEALGRPPEFDPATNSIVRSEMHRLREKLARFYEIEATDHKLRIVLPVGAYVPEFLASDKNPVPSMGSTVETDKRIAFSPLPAKQWGIRRVSYVALPLLVAITAGVVLWRTQGEKPAVFSAPGATGPALAAPGLAPAGSGVRVLAGYSKANFVDRSGLVWQPDQYFEGGTVESRPLRYVARAPETFLFQNARLGEFSYAIPLDPGVYEMRLYFAETFFGPELVAGGGEASRFFSIEMNGAPLLWDFDPYSDAGGSNTAHVRAFKDVVPGPDGLLRLSFLRLRDSPFINAIEIVPGTPGKLLPVRIVAQEQSFTDSAGRLWAPDRYFKGGQAVRRKASLSNTEEAELYAGERFGNFSYSIPVAPGRYTVRLYFAETYFGTELAPSGGGGSRLSNVYGNSQILLRHFDIFKGAGGSNRALVKTFWAVEPNAAGQILLEFVPVKNYACVNAIEVLSE